MDTSKLGRILDMLDADRIAEVLGNKNEMARETFSLARNTVSSHPEFYDIIMRYYRHHFAETVCRGVPIPDDMAASDARSILDQAYRDQGGYEGAYNNARTGKAGGMRGVLNAIAGAMRNRQEEQYIEHIFFTHIDPMDYDESVEIMKQYLDRFGGYLAPSDRARSPHDLSRNYDVIIKAHARAMGTIRGMMKRL